MYRVQAGLRFDGSKTAGCGEGRCRRGQVCDCLLVFWGFCLCVCGGGVRAVLHNAQLFVFVFVVIVKNCSLRSWDVDAWASLTDIYTNPPLPFFTSPSSC
jgi:hypothetical protein